MEGINSMDTDVIRISKTELNEIWREAYERGKRMMRSEMADRIFLELNDLLILIRESNKKDGLLERVYEEVYDMKIRSDDWCKDILGGETYSIKD